MSEGITVRISGEALDVLRAIADKQGISLFEATRRSIALAKWAQDHTDAGGRILVKTPDGSFREIDGWMEKP